MLASALRTDDDAHCLRRLEPTDPAIVALREWSRLSEDLTRERIRLANRMREQLWRYYPQFLKAGRRRRGSAVGAGPVAEPADAAGRPACSADDADPRLKQHRIRRLDAGGLRERLRAPAVKLTPAAAEAATTHVRLVVERLALVNRQLDHVRGQLEEVVHRIVEVAPAGETDSSADTDPDPSDAAILLSMPGIGVGVLATLLSEGHDVLRRRDYAALRCLCGVAPVTKRSGKSLYVERRLAAHGRLREAVFHWAPSAARYDAVSRGKYQALRARGHGHARALRSVADRLLNVACAMLRDGACFDPQRVRVAAT